MRLLTSEEMQRVEAHAAKFGLSYHRMMENAGAACARNIRSVVEKETGARRNVAILCGKGNNGGDGFVIARKLLDSGYRVCLLLLAGYPGTNEAEYMYKMTAELNIPTIWYDADRPKAAQTIKSADILVDAVFGFSFHGALRPEMQEVFALFNDAKGLKFAVDIPSGVYCDSGECAEGCVQADYTIAVSALKPAHILHPGSNCCGDIIVASIGIPEESFAAVGSGMYAYHADEIAARFPKRKIDAHKGDFGHLLCICGSYCMPGAAYMAAKAALRSGVGLVTVAYPQALHPILTAKLTETLFMPLAQTADGALSRQCIPALLKNLDRYDAIVIGCGLSVCDDTAAVLQAVLENAKVPVIVDADGINLLAKNIDLLQNAACPVVLTPHPKEMSRLCGLPVTQVQQNRTATARAFSQQQGVYLVLKGSNTVIAFPDDSHVYVNVTGNNGLSKGGSGDVLAGMLGAFLSQKMPLRDAICVGVYMHGHCADEVAQKLSKTGMLPTDVIEALPACFAAFES
ncbi:MAG: NAD(P)H-hydrate dehydratase [Clostridia bacterium]|nr:NAD(P)H-hydrate dehydratase [Clostridia bacterium]